MLWSWCFAYTDNCNLVENFNDFGTLPENFKNAFDNTPWNQLLTEAGLKRALVNLKAYCCNEWKFKWKCDTNISQQLKQAVTDPDIKWADYPKSPYLYDHLVSVMLRRLSEYSYMGVEMDKQAKERYEEYSWYKNNTDWRTAGDFTSIYNKYRHKSDNRENSAPKYRLSLYNGVSSSSYQNAIEWVWNEQTTVRPDTEKINNYDNWDLTTKHLNTCLVATRFAIRLWNFDSSDLTLLEPQCINKVYSIMYNYSSLYKDIVETQTNLLAQNTLNNYYQYFNARRSTVNTTITRAYWYLFWIVKLVWKITAQCN